MNPTYPTLTREQDRVRIIRKNMVKQKTALEKNNFRRNNVKLIRLQLKFERIERS